MDAELGRVSFLPFHSVVRMSCASDFYCRLCSVCDAINDPVDMLEAAFLSVDHFYNLPCSHFVVPRKLDGLLALDLREADLKPAVVADVVALLYVLNRLCDDQQALEMALYGITGCHLIELAKAFALRHCGVAMTHRDDLAGLLCRVDDLCRSLLSDRATGQVDRELSLVEDWFFKSGAMSVPRWQPYASGCLPWQELLDSTQAWWLEAQPTGNLSLERYLFATMPEPLSEQWRALLKSGYLGGCFVAYMGDFEPLDRAVFISRGDSDHSVRLHFMPKQCILADLTAAASLPCVVVGLRLSRDRARFISTSTLDAGWLAVSHLDESAPAQLMLDASCSMTESIRWVDPQTEEWYSPLAGSTCSEDVESSEYSWKAEASLNVTVQRADYRMASLSMGKERSIANQLIDRQGAGYPLCKTLMAMAHELLARHAEGRACGTLMLYHFSLVAGDQSGYLPRLRSDSCSLSVARWAELCAQCSDLTTKALTLGCGREVLALFHSLFDQVPVHSYSQYSSPELRHFIVEMNRLGTEGEGVSSVSEFALGVRMPKDLQAADVWSLGKIWEHLTFSADQQWKLHCSAIPVRTLGQNIWPELIKVESLMAHMLSQFPEQRPTMAVVVERLLAIDTTFNGGLHVPVVCKSF